MEIPISDLNITDRDLPIYNTKMVISANVTENGTGINMILLDVTSKHITVKCELSCQQFHTILAHI